jgi:hypothetical protein
MGLRDSERSAHRSLAGNTRPPTRPESDRSARPRRPRGASPCATCGSPPAPRSLRPADGRYQPPPSAPSFAAAPRARPNHEQRARSADPTRTPAAIRARSNARKGHRVGTVPRTVRPTAHIASRWPRERPRDQQIPPITLDQLLSRRHRPGNDPSGAPPSSRRHPKVGSSASNAEQPHPLVRRARESPCWRSIPPEARRSRTPRRARECDMQVPAGGDSAQDVRLRRMIGASLRLGACGRPIRGRPLGAASSLRTPRPWDSRRPGAGAPALRTFLLKSSSATFASCYFLSLASPRSLPTLSWLARPTSSASPCLDSPPVTAAGWPVPMTTQRAPAGLRGPPGPGNTPQRAHQCRGRARRPVGLF